MDSVTGEKQEIRTDRFQEDSAWALFLQDEISVTDRLTLTLGARYDHFETDLEDRLDDGADFRSNDSAWSPNIGATYSFSPAVNLFAYYGRAFRNPPPPPTSRTSISIPKRSTVSRSG